MRVYASLQEQPMLSVNRNNMTTNASQRRIRAIHGHVAECGPVPTPVLAPQVSPLSIFCQF